MIAEIRLFLVPKGLRNFNPIFKNRGSLKRRDIFQDLLLMTDCTIRPPGKVFSSYCGSAYFIGATSNKIVISGHGNDLGSFSREEHSLDGSVGGLLRRGINHTKAFVVSAFLNGTDPFAAIENNSQSTTLGIVNGLKKIE
jgi:hypothetical protein